MKVSIKPGTETRGLIWKTEVHTVRLVVQMTETEIAAAQAANMMKLELFHFQWDEKNGAGHMVTVGELAKGFDKKATFADFFGASTFRTDVKDLLITLKGALDAKLEESDEEFEL